MEDLVSSSISFRNLLRLNLNLFANLDLALLSFAPNANGDGVVACPGKSVLAVVSGGGSSPFPFSERRKSLWSLMWSITVVGKSLKKIWRSCQTFASEILFLLIGLCLITITYILFCSNGPF